nr:probable LRR receptor-like serine/threonine-protein kinase At1g07650 isoform X4 [Ipomoea batatas]
MFVFIFLLLCFNPIGIRAQTPALPLPDSERNALSEIADQLGKKGWNFSLNPCDGDPSWNTPPQDAWPIYQNSVLCNCTYSDGFCHVENMLDFDPPNHKKKTLIIAVSVAASLVAILIILGIAWRKRYLKSRISKEQELMGLDLKTGFFTFRQIKAATDNFSVANKLGEGGFGAVYKGTLLDGTIVAVKQLSSKSKQGNREFVNEIGMISGLQHPNVVRLYGCCIEGNQLLLVYEYVENNSLARALFGPQESRLQIDWPTRQRICVGIAKGLAFLHEESALKIVHRDIKAANVLLDKNLNPKISDFGLAKLDEEENTHISTRVAGTILPFLLHNPIFSPVKASNVHCYGILLLWP